MKVGEAQQMEEGLRRELARVGRDIEVAIIVIFKHITHLNQCSR